jgi:AraC family transcriptional regulator
MSDRFLREEYRARINRVEDFIQSHLDQELDLARLAEVAAFSKYHFSRIFAMMTGESLFHYIQRLRVERAASLLLSNPRRSITDIAFACGFSSIQAFSRAFSGRFGLSAGSWRKLGGRTPETLGRLGPSASTGARGLQPGAEVQPERVDVVQAKAVEVIYLRYTGPFQGDSGLFAELFGRLSSWAAARSLLTPQTRSFCMVHDNPAVTDDRRIRLSCCLSVPPEVQPDGEIGRMTIAGGRCARARFIIDDRQYGQAWAYLYARWLPGSGYQPAEQPAFEEYPAETGESQPAGGAAAGSNQADSTQSAAAPAGGAAEETRPKHQVLLWLPVQPL